MANTLPSYGILSTENFPNLRAAAAPLGSYCHDFTPEVANAGTTISVGYEDVGSASLYTAAGEYTTSDSTVNSVTVTVQEPYHKELYLTPNEIKSYGEDKLTKRFATAAVPVFQEITKQALSALSGSSVSTTSASNFTFNTVLSASTVVSNNGAQGPQTFLVTRNAFNALLVEAKNANYFITANNEAGVSSFKYNILPQVTVQVETSLTTKSWITTPDSVALVIRLPEELSGYSRTIFADVGYTEAAVAVDLFEDIKGGKIKARAQACAGVATGRPGASAFVTMP